MKMNRRARFSWKWGGGDVRRIEHFHKFTDVERQKMTKFESINVREPVNRFYTSYVLRTHNAASLSHSGQPALLKWVAFLAMGTLSAVTAGLLMQTIDLLTEGRLMLIRSVSPYCGGASSFVAVILSMLYVAVATGLTLLAPAAAGSGIPEIMGYLNGVDLPNIFLLRAIPVKFFSCLFAVSSGIPVGPEGPMIHLGGMLGYHVAGLTGRINAWWQLKRVRRRHAPPPRGVSSSFPTSPSPTVSSPGGSPRGMASFSGATREIPSSPSSPHAHLPQSPRPGLAPPVDQLLLHDRRDLICGGVGAGVAAAFGAPLGGLLFVFEELASFWDKSLTWTVFFGNIVAGLVIGIIKTSFDTWRPTGQVLYLGSSSMFGQPLLRALDMNILVLFPAILVGVLCGLLGAVFTVLNIKVTRLRGRYITPYTWRRMLDPVLLTLIFVILAHIIPLGLHCTRAELDAGDVLPCHSSADTNISCALCQFDRPFKELYRCPCADASQISLASALFLGPSDATVRCLLQVKKPTEVEFEPGTLVVFFLVYYIFAALFAGSALSSGLVVPFLIIGSAVGRLFGLLFQALVESACEDCEWADPGLLALIGAAGFFSGVSRLTIALTVIILETTNSLQHLIPVMFAVMSAKFVADKFTHPLYHALLEVKCVPFLDVDSVVQDMECFSVDTVMASPVSTVLLNEDPRKIRGLLNNTSHNMFPVVSNEDGHLVGTISADHLVVLLSDAVNRVAASGSTSPTLSHEQEIDVVKSFEGLKRRETAHKRAARANLLPRRSARGADQLQRPINLANFVDSSPFTVRSGFSLQLTYALFRGMALRHIIVLNNEGKPVGVVSRKDLIGQNIAEKLAAPTAVPVRIPASEYHRT